MLDETFREIICHNSLRNFDLNQIRCSFGLSYFETKKRDRYVGGLLS